MKHRAQYSICYHNCKTCTYFSKRDIAKQFIIKTLYIHIRIP